MQIKKIPGQIKWQIVYFWRDVKYFSRKIFMCPFGKHLNAEVYSVSEIREAFTGSLLRTWKRHEAHCVYCGKVDVERTAEMNKKAPIAPAN